MENNSTGKAVYTAISSITGKLASLGGIAKDKKAGSGGGSSYNFRGIDDVYNALAPLLAEHGLVILPRVLRREVAERTSKSGTAMFYVTVETEFDFVAAADGSIHTVKTFGEAMDMSDKATNKAMSAAYKYAAFMAFAIPTEGDNDSENQSHEVSAHDAKANLKPASQLPPPTNANKPQNKPDPELEKLPKYEHGDVPKEDRATKAQVASFRQIGAALFNLTGADLNKRLLAAVSKIISMNVSSLEGLHHTDAQSALEAIEQAAIKKGVWSAQAEAA